MATISPEAIKLPTLLAALLDFLPPPDVPPPPDELPPSADPPSTEFDKELAKLLLLPLDPSTDDSDVGLPVEAG